MNKAKRLLHLMREAVRKGKWEIWIDGKEIVSDRIPWKRLQQAEEGLVTAVLSVDEFRKLLPKIARGDFPGMGEGEAEDLKRLLKKGEAFDYTNEFTRGKSGTVEVSYEVSFDPENEGEEIYFKLYFWWGGYHR